MKVLQKSSNGLGWKKKIKCTGKGNIIENSKKGKMACGSKLEIEVSDIFITKRVYIDGSDDICYTIKCPVCGCLTDLDERELPSDIRTTVLYLERHRDNEMEME